MRVADYIFKYLKDYGIDIVFLVVGGGAMHLNDALKKSGIPYVCFHHEQACAMAAEGYSRISGRMACICVTSGPGGTNALTGIVGAWLDSVPILVFSGQVNQTRTKHLRQLGDQEINIIDIVRPVTKYASMVDNPDMISTELEMALHYATTERFGPVWLDIPLRVQSALY